MEISLSPMKKSITSFFARYHVVVFSVIVIGGLAAVILILSSIIQSSTQTTDYSPKANNASFDEATIDRVNQLKSRDETAGELVFPDGRINPFVE